MKLSSTISKRFILDKFLSSPKALSNFLIELLMKWHNFFLEINQIIRIIRFQTFKDKCIYRNRKINYNRSVFEEVIICLVNSIANIYFISPSLSFKILKFNYQNTWINELL